MNTHNNGLIVFDGKALTPNQRIAHLKDFRESKAFTALEGEYVRKLEALDAKIFSLKIDPDIREHLIYARDEIVRRFNPAKLIEDGVKDAENTLELLARKAQDG